MFRSCQIIIRELCCSLLKLHYNIHNVIPFFANKVLWQHVMLCRNVLCVEQLARYASHT